MAAVGIDLAKLRQHTLGQPRRDADAQGAGDQLHSDAGAPAIRCRRDRLGAGRVDEPGKSEQPQPADVGMTDLARRRDGLHGESEYTVAAGGERLDPCRPGPAIDGHRSVGTGL